jgi:hypothetical protein
VQPLELLLITLLATRIVAAAWLPPRTTAWRAISGVVLLAALAAHLLAEGARWNAGPLYGLTVLVATIDLLASRRTPPSHTPRPSQHWWPRSVALLGVTAVALPIWLLPVPNLPAPTGPFAVGTDTIEIALPSTVPRAVAGVDRARARLW